MATYFGFAIADSMFLPVCSVERTILTVEHVKQKLEKLDVMCLNPSHKNTIEVAIKKFGLAISIPEKAPQIYLPYIKPMKYEDKFTKGVSIFEKTLSEFGSYSLFVFDDNDVKLIKTTYGSDDILKEFDNLFSAISYIQKHHYYEKRLKR